MRTLVVKKNGTAVIYDPACEGRVGFLASLLSRLILIECSVMDKPEHTVGVIEFEETGKRLWAVCPDPDPLVLKVFPPVIEARSVTEKDEWGITRRVGGFGDVG